MSSVTVPRSAREGVAAHGSLAEALIAAFATADDVVAGMERVTALLAAEDGIDRVEWWAPADGGAALRLSAASGTPSGERHGMPFGPAGALVVDGDEAPEAVVPLVRVVRQRWADEQLAGHTVLLA